MMEYLMNQPDSFSAILLQESEPYWKNYLKHPFIQALADGSLDQNLYRNYMIQDYLYLKEYGKCFAQGVLKGKDEEFRQICRHYLQRISDFELEVHRGAFQQLDISSEQLKETDPSLTSLGYTSYMLKECYEGEEAEILTAILACALSYEYIAEKMVEHNPDCLNHPLYREWFEQYCSLEYAEENNRLCALLDRLTGHLDGNRLEHLKEIFHTCSRFEMGFWNQAWNPESEVPETF